MVEQKETLSFLGRFFANHEEAKQYVAIIDECDGVPGQVQCGQWYIQAGPNGDGKPYVWRPDPNDPDGACIPQPFVDAPDYTEVVGLQEYTTSQITNAINNLNVDVTKITNFDASVLTTVVNALQSGNTTEVIVNEDGTLKVEVKDCTVSAADLCGHPIHPSAEEGSQIVTLNVLNQILQNQNSGLSTFLAPVICLRDPSDEPDGEGIPATPNIGDRYIASASANGWVEGRIYEYNGTNWTETVPADNVFAYVDCEDFLYVHSENVWKKYLSTLSFEDNRISDETLNQITNLLAVANTFITEAQVQAMIDANTVPTITTNPDLCLTAQRDQQEILQHRKFQIGGRDFVVNRHFFAEKAGEKRWRTAVSA